MRGNSETRSTETYPYRCTLSTLPADGTLALAEASAVAGSNSGDSQTLDSRSGLRRTWVRLGERGRRDPPAAEARRGESLFSRESGYTNLRLSLH